MTTSQTANTSINTDASDKAAGAGYVERIAILSSAILVAACAGMGWTHPSKNQSDFNQDRYQCQQETARMYPSQISGSNPTYNTNCTNMGGGYTSCTTNATQAPQYDINVNNRNIAFSSCMKAQGWSWSWGH